MKLSEFIKQLQGIQQHLDKDIDIEVLDVWNDVDIPIEGVHLKRNVFCGDCVQLHINLQPVLENI